MLTYPEEERPESLAALVVAHTGLDPAALRFAPIRTGMHTGCSRASARFTPQ